MRCRSPWAAAGAAAAMSRARAPLTAAARGTVMRLTPGQRWTRREVTPEASGVLEREQRLVVHRGREVVVLGLETQHVGLEISHPLSQPPGLRGELGDDAGVGAGAHVAEERLGHGFPPLVVRAGTPRAGRIRPQM